MKQDLYIRADGSAFLGLGHLVRSLSLAQYLNNQYRVFFVCLQVPGSFKRKIIENGIDVIEIENEADFFALVNSGSIVVLDGYKFMGEYQKVLKQVGCKVVCIDDIHEGEYFADLIINQAPGISSEMYDAQSYTNFALGPDYSLLRPPFIQAAKKRRDFDELTSVLICFGGSDVKNLTKQTFEIVKNFNQFKKIIIITGSAYEHTLEFGSSSDSKIEHYSDLSAEKMTALMSQTELAIVPASGILFEALAMGCQIISGYYNNNQIQIYKGFKELGAFTDAKTFQPYEIVSALNEIKPGRTEKIIDGKSPQRFVKLFNELSQKNLKR